MTAKFLPRSSACRVLVLMGGPDAEREVSIMSGTEVAKALRSRPEFDVLEVMVDRPTAIELAAYDADVIFPVLHGPFGEGGPLQVILESLGVPYVGCEPVAAALAMDKVATKARVSAAGVPTPRCREIVRGEPIDLEVPLVIKPAADGSSVDLRICRTAEEVLQARLELEGKRDRLLAESFIKGREVTVGIVQGKVLPIIEILPATAYYDYEAKYIRDDTQYILNPVFAPGIAEALREYTMLAWEAIGCRDLARADYIVDERGAWFLEINTMPGMTTHSLVPKAAREIGIEMPELCAMLLERARFNASASISR